VQAQQAQGQAAEAGDTKNGSDDGAGPNGDRPEVPERDAA
jgi:hypothetical protein